MKKLELKEYISSQDYTGLPRWHSGKESACQCKRHRFDPWVGKSPWRRKWQPTPVFWPRKSHGQRSLVGYSPQGHKELDMTEHTRAYSPFLVQTGQASSSLLIMIQIYFEHYNLQPKCPHHSSITAVPEQPLDVVNGGRMPRWHHRSLASPGKALD